jgi:hypothetical protein
VTGGSEMRSFSGALRCICGLAAEGLRKTSTMREVAGGFAGFP